MGCAFLRFSSHDPLQAVLGYELRREGESHNCLRDAKAAMELVLAKLEHGFDDPIAIAGRNVHSS